MGIKYQLRGFNPVVDRHFTLYTGRSLKGCIKSYFKYKKNGYKHLMFTWWIGA